MSTFELRIVTPEGLFYSGEVEYLSVQTTDGRVGFMRGALPRVGILCAGRVDFKTSVIDKSAECGDGIIRVSADGVTLITQFAESEDAPRVQNTDDGELAAREYQAAKVKIAASIKGMREKSSGGE